MSWALTTTLFAILGSSLVVLSAICLTLWRRVRALSRPDRQRASTDLPPPPVATEPQGSPRVRYEVARRLDELTGRHRALEDRLARIEASATEAAMAIASGSARRVDRGASATTSGPILIAVPDLSATPNPALEAAAELDRRFGGVWARADAGMPAEAIARETGHPIGQVELILGLRRQVPIGGAGAGPDA